MYNYSGLVFRIWAVAGVFFALGILMLAFVLRAPSPKRKNIKIAVFALAFSVVLATFYLWRILWPNVGCYNGEFIESMRAPRVAPPVSVTWKYVFGDEENEKKSFYLDSFSRKKMIEDGFVEGQEYTIYYDTFTNIIVRIESQ